MGRDVEKEIARLDKEIKQARVQGSSGGFISPPTQPWHQQGFSGGSVTPTQPWQQNSPYGGSSGGSDNTPLIITPTQPWQQNSSYGGSSGGGSSGGSSHGQYASPKRTALIITVSYVNQKGALPGTINDGRAMRAYLQREGYTITWMRDDKLDARHKLYPNKANIKAQIKLLARNAANGDVIWLQYSGHGTQVSGYASGEADGLSEAICPRDVMTAGVITDAWLNQNFINALPKCEAMVVFDCCHSGSALDLRYQYNRQSGQLEVSENRPARNPNGACVLYLSGCKDDQVSLEIRGSGLLTTEFLRTVRDEDVSLQDFITRIQDACSRRSSQVPMLSCTHQINLGVPLSKWSMAISKTIFKLM